MQEQQHSRKASQKWAPDPTTRFASNRQRNRPWAASASPQATVVDFSKLRNKTKVVITTQPSWRSSG